MTWAHLLAEVWVAACPARAPCLGVTRPASPECPSPQCWGLVCGGRCVAYSWTPCGRCRCRWGGLCACSWVWACLLSEVWVVVRVVVGVDGADYLRVRGCGWAYWPSSGLFWWSLVDDFCVFKGVVASIGRRLGRLGRRGCLLVDDLCGAGVGLSSVRGCGRGCWPSSRSPRCLRVVASGVGEASLGGARLWVRLWVVGVTRKDV